MATDERRDAAAANRRHALRPFVGGWRIGRRGKVWIGAGDWLRLEVGTVGGLWFFAGPVTLSAAHHVQDDRHVFTASLYFRRGWTT